MWTPFWAAVEVDGALDLGGHHASRDPSWRTRIAFETPVTPARVSESRDLAAPTPGDR